MSAFGRKNGVGGMQAGGKLTGGNPDRPAGTGLSLVGFRASGDSSGGIWIWRLRAKDGHGREVVKTGSLGPAATMRVELSR